MPMEMVTVSFDYHILWISSEYFLKIKTIIGNAGSIKIVWRMIVVEWLTYREAPTSGMNQNWLKASAPSQFLQLQLSRNFIFWGGMGGGVEPSKRDLLFSMTKRHWKLSKFQIKLFIFRHINQWRQLIY